MTPEPIHDRITVDPAVHHGKPVIQGTRVPVEVVLGSLAGGMDIETVCEEYDIDELDVYAALEYARKAVAGEEFRSLTA